MFRFKQFTVHQENSAMKVCTDSCLFGALIRSEAPENALDIGAGTGLLSLMVAQRYPTLTVDAVEMDAGAAHDARLNFAQSPFHERLTLHEGAVQDFTPPRLYDLIFCNPPFYENQLQSPHALKNLAHHGAGLSFRDLITASTRLLKNRGVMWILLPPFEMASFTRQAVTAGLHAEEHFRIRHKTEKPVFREVARFSFLPCPNPPVQEIIIYENDKYSSIFAGMLRDYYLIF